MNDSEFERTFYAVANRAQKRREEHDETGVSDDSPQATEFERLLAKTSTLPVPSWRTRLSFYGKAQSVRKEGCTMRQRCEIDPTQSKIISKIPKGACMHFLREQVLPRDATDDDSVAVTRLNVLLPRVTLERFLTAGLSADSSYVPLHSVPDCAEAPGFVEGWVSLNPPFRDDPDPIVTVLTDPRRYR